MKLALHRSIVFWFGLLAMTFVCWAWRDSMSGAVYARVPCFVVVHCAGGLMLENTAGVEWKWEREIDRKVVVRLDDVGFGFHTASPRTGNASPWPPLMIATGGKRPAVFIPHWLILLAVAALWLGLLFWRVRRRARAGDGNP